MKYLIFVLFFFFLNYPIANAYAETRYVTDQLVITLRQGKGNQYKIIKTLKTGTPLEILEEGETYLKVRTNDGEEGYALAQYITSDIPKTYIIDRLEKQVDKLQSSLDKLQETKKDIEAKFSDTSQLQKSEIQELAAENSEIVQTLSATENALKSATEKYNTLFEQSKNVVEITQERDQLREVNEKISNELQMLQVENSKLKKSGMIKWFLAGGGVFFFGWLIGKLSKKKKSHW